MLFSGVKKNLVSEGGVEPSEAKRGMIRALRRVERSRGSAFKRSQEEFSERGQVATAYKLRCWSPKSETRYDTRVEASGTKPRQRF